MKSPAHKMAHELIELHGHNQALLIAKLIFYDMAKEQELEGVNFMDDVICVIEHCRHY